MIIVGLTFLALEFDRAERLLERMILWGERAAAPGRAHHASCSGALVAAS